MEVGKDKFDLRGERESIATFGPKFGWQNHFLHVKLYFLSQKKIGNFSDMIVNMPLKHIEITLKKIKPHI